MALVLLTVGALLSPVLAARSAFVVLPSAGARRVLSHVPSPLRSRYRDGDDNAPSSIDLLDADVEDRIDSILTEALHKMKTISDPDFFASSPLSCDKLKQLHQTCVDAVEVGPSTIPDAGKGLFARRDVPAGEILCFYPIHALGVNLKEHSSSAITVTLKYSDAKYFQQSTDRDTDSYLIELLGSRPIGSTVLETELGAYPYANVNPNNPTMPGWTAHFINDGATVKSNTEEGVLSYFATSLDVCQNVAIVPFGPAPICVTVTTRRVAAGEELFSSYGMAYWLDALVGQHDAEGRWTEKTDAIRSYEKQAAGIMADCIHKVREDYAEEAAALHRVFDGLRQEE